MHKFVQNAQFSLTKLVSYPHPNLHILTQKKDGEKCHLFVFLPSIILDKYIILQFCFRTSQQHSAHISNLKELLSPQRYKLS